MPDFDPKSLLRPDLLNLPPYVPLAVPIEEMERLVKLDLNENPYGPSPKALAAIANARVWHRYLTTDELSPAVAAYAGVGPEHVVLGNGADEILDLIMRVIVQPDDVILDCPPSFEMYRFSAKVNGGKLVEVPRREDRSNGPSAGFSLDVEGIERAVASEHPKIVIVTNPNNPDGGLLSPAEIERLLALPALLILDEAYAEFAGTTLAKRVPSQPNLVVVRTFSKWAGLAGLRIGYGVAPKWLADQMMRAKPPFDVNAAAIVAAQASLEDAEYLMANVRRITAERERLSGRLAALGYIQPLKSATNFVLCRLTGHTGAEIRSRLAERGILVRAYGSPRLRGYFRISVGTPEQDDKLLQALKEIGA